MGIPTELIGQSIFHTEKDGGQTNTPPPAETKPVAVQAPEPQKEPPKKKFFLAALVILLFFFSSLAGLYIIFSGGYGGGSNPAPKTTRPSSRIASRSAKSSKDGVALIRIRGEISEPTSSSGWGDQAGASTIAKRIRSAADKDNIKAIILDINSPGGTVAAVQDIYNAVLYARETKKKPVVSLMRDVAASGGYYISAACDKIVAQPGTLTGSIGVIFQTSNFEGLMTKVGVQFGAIKSGKLKDMGSPFRAMTDEEKNLFQSLIDDSYDQFFQAVKTGRPDINTDTLRGYADGRVFTGRQALKIGLIDVLGGEDEALKAAGDLSGLKNPEIVTVKTNTFMDWFMTNINAEMSNKNLLGQVEAAAAPKMSYLWTL